MLPSYVESARYDLALTCSANSEIGIYLFEWSPTRGAHSVSKLGGRARDKSETLMSWAYRCRFSLRVASVAIITRILDYARAGWILLV